MSRLNLFFSDSMRLPFMIICHGSSIVRKRVSEWRTELVGEEICGRVRVCSDA